MAKRAPQPCPICGRDAPPRDAEPKNPAFPFCSPACKLIDLGRWLDGAYRVPGPPDESSLQADGGRLRSEDDE
jgi:endogenous inhibitor of DNA gyrase (YacG/DUF329 family)